MSGWRGTLLKEWTVQTVIAAGSGLPETPIYLAATPGTGVTGSLRPNTTGASVYTLPAGAGSAEYHLNAAAYTAPVAGQWGNAGRNSIEGPDQFSLTGSLQRTFRLKDHLTLDFRVDSTNLLNHVVFSTWNTIVPPAVVGGSGATYSTFGLPASANAMRSLQFTMRLRY